MRAQVTTNYNQNIRQRHQSYFFPKTCACASGSFSRSLERLEAPLFSLSGDKLGTFTPCDISCGKITEGRFNFIQHVSGGIKSKEKIMFDGDIIEAQICQIDSENAVYDETCHSCVVSSSLFSSSDSFAVVKGVYRSKSQQSKGETGSVIACFQDNGEGNFAVPDTAFVGVESGPFEGFTVEGTIQGNAQVRECD